MCNAWVYKSKTPKFTKLQGKEISKRKKKEKQEGLMIPFFFVFTLF
jgi:hypothetical protein